MRWLLYAGFLLLLCSCSGASSVNKIADSTITTVKSLEKTLTSECKTDGVKASIQAIKTQINAIVVACDTDKELLQSKIDKLKIIIIGLIGVLLLTLKKILL